MAAALDRADAVRADDMLLLTFFLAGLRARLAPPTARGNPYLRDDGTAQIDLFAVMLRHLPLLRAGRLATESLLPHLHGATRATVLALGIGHGGQERDLIARADWLEQVTVVGVDVAPDSLAAAGRTLHAAGRQARTAVDVQQVARATEDLDDAFWEALARLPRPLVVTASFALHHMRDTPGGDARTALLRRLHAQRPAALALCEPDSDHHRAPLRTRLANAWQHYGTLFAAIDATGANPAEKGAMKRFFGREILDVVGAPEEDRHERHEPTAVWLARLTATGFRPQPQQPAPPLGQPGFTATRRATHTELAFKGVPLAAVITAVPR
ncbi:hypothetical protein GCM10009738_62590 [Kitasatospora viridis]